MTVTIEDLSGTVALVTGASSGIGEAAALALARHGAAVAITARRSERLDDLAGRIADAGGRAFVLEADITERAAAEAVVERTVAELGRLDTLVNNAGVMLLGPVQDAPIDEWERMLAINLNAPLYCAHAALPHLLAAAADGPRNVADMVNVSSVGGRVARNGSAVYNLTKFGLGGFSESLRQEVTGRNVRVSLIEPGAVATELRTHIRSGVREAHLDRFVDVEMMEATDLADTIVFVVTRPRRMSISEVLIRPTDQQG
jgi:NADP-dependent 3-hydroxy acid dehydrogenase YdfG